MLATTCIQPVREAFLRVHDNFDVDDMLTNSVVTRVSSAFLQLARQSVLHPFSWPFSQFCIPTVMPCVYRYHYAVRFNEITRPHCQMTSHRHVTIESCLDDRLVLEAMK